MVGTTRRIAMVGFPGMQMLDVTGPLEVFSLASRLLQERNPAAPAPYEVVLLARKAGPVASSSGLALVAGSSWRRAGSLDTVLVSGGAGAEAALRDEELIRWLRGRAPAARRFGSVCTGALLLAQAGLLAGRRVTTHWAFVSRLAALAPTVRIEPDALFVRDDSIWTSAGVTAGMDMALAMVEEDWGRKLALDVADRLVMYLQRPGGQAQRSPALAAQARSAQGRFSRLVPWIIDNLGMDLGVPALAEQAGMSPRHFARVFAAETGQTPAKFVEDLRFDAARALLADGNAPVAQVARMCGFGSPETLRRVFKRRAGVGPGGYRLRARRDALSLPVVEAPAVCERSDVDGTMAHPPAPVAQGIERPPPKR